MSENSQTRNDLLAPQFRLNSGMEVGMAAVISQDYSEANKKNGLQWAASRLINGATPNTPYYSVIEVGSKPIDLKRREFAISGTKLIADIFEGPTYSGGNVDPVYNSNGITPHTFEFILKGNVTVTNEGTNFAPTIYAVGPASNQSKGISNALYGSNYILKPNTVYLLKFYSADAQNQDIAVRIEGYEGELDLPKA